MAGKLFNPGSLSIRNVKSNARENGNIVNPPRYAQLGGLTSAAKAKTMGMQVEPPGSTIRKHPASG